MQLGLMSLGDEMNDPVTGQEYSASEKYKMLIEAAEIADRSGFYSVNIGEHHGLPYALSAPPVLLAAIAERTSRIRLSTAVTLAANLDPLRVAEDYATLDVISDGRAEIVAGRGNFFETTYELFGQDPAESAERFEEALVLIHDLWPGKPINWTGKFRPRINNEYVQPTPIQPDTTSFWVAGGSSKETAILAGRLGWKLMLPSAFGKPTAFLPIADVYREAFDAANHKHKPEVAASWHGWVGESSEQAHKRFEPRYREYHAFTARVIKSVHSNPPPFLDNPFDYDQLSNGGPAIVGSPTEFIDKLAAMYEILQTDKNVIKMDMGGVPRQEFLDMVTLMGEEVIPGLDKIK